MKIIIGAGLSGLIAAHVFPKATIFESSPPSNQSNHRAVLRFRSDAVSKSTGIEFKKVKVWKGIYSEREFVRPSIRLSNLYSQKILGIISDRSINNIEPSYRYVAPDNFHQILSEELAPRIEYNTSVVGINTSLDERVQIFIANQKIPITPEAVISTAPVGVIANMLKDTLPFKPAFREIHNTRFKISGSDVHQTIYYPDQKTPVYRATLTGEDLIIESMTPPESFNIQEVFYSFGIPINIASAKEVSSQRYGKIADVDSRKRRQFINLLTRKYNIYSVGRFAIWKNILLDDVVDDALKIKAMIMMDDYGKDKILKLES